MRWASVSYVVVMSFPWWGVPPLDLGLDSGWAYAVNAWPGAGYRFGRDVIYTSGPLGFLLYSRDIGSNVVVALTFQTLAHVLFGVLLFYHARRQRMLSAVVLFAIAYAGAVSRGLLYEYRLLILVALLLLVDPQDRLWWRFSWPLSALLTGLFVATKFTIGVAAILMVGAAALIRLARREIGARALAGAAGALGLSLVSSAILFMGGLGYLPRFIHASWEVSSGYAVAMSIVIGAGAVPGFGLAAVGAALVGLFSARRTWLLGAIMVGPLFIVFKHAYVRHQGEWIFPFVMAALAITMLIAASRRQTALVCMLSAAVVGSMLFATTHWDFPRRHPRWDVATMSGEQGWMNLGNVVRLRPRRRGLAAESERNLAAARLPADWLVRIHASGGTVDVLPWEIGFVPANNLPWDPSPVLQSFSAYTDYLDRWNAEHYRRADAPLFLLAEFRDIDGRHPLMAAPATWREVLSRYRALAATESVVLLQRRAQPTSAPVAIGRVHVRLGEWTSVPAFDDLVFGRLRMELRPIGKLVHLAWRIPPVWIEIRSSRGRASRYRIVPPTAGAGLLLGRPPVNFGEFSDLFGGRPTSDPVTEFRIGGPGAGYYDDLVEVLWERGP